MSGTPSQNEHEGGHEKSSENTGGEPSSAARGHILEIAGSRPADAFILKAA
jgi:hypothetical protein